MIFAYHLKKLLCYIIPMRKFYYITFVLLALLCVRPDAFAASGNTLTADEAKNLLKELVPKVKILYVQQAPIAGLWEIGVDADNKKGVIYIDHDRKHFVSGTVIDLKTKVNLTQESFQKINKVDVSKIPLKDALVMGDKNAKNKIIVFDDPD